MAQYKITRVYLVEAGSRTQAGDVLTEARRSGSDADYLEYESVKEADQRRGGWGSTHRQQPADKGEAK